MENYLNTNLKCVKPLLTTWGYKSEAGSWDIYFPSVDLNSTSIQELNNWHANIFRLTVDSFSSLLRAYKVSFGSGGTKVKPMFFNWQPGESYEEYMESIYQAIQQYPVIVSAIELEIDIFAYVYTEESSTKPVRVWVREFGNSIEMGEILICLSTNGEEPYAYFAMNHTLFYPFPYGRRDPFSYGGDDNDDNTELFDLNKPLLEEALKKWEKNIGVEIEPDGLTGIYKYGFLPYKDWNR